MIVSIDVETRSALDLKKVGAHAYALHPSTEILWVAWRVQDGGINMWSPCCSAVPRQLIKDLSDMSCGRAWGAAFEHVVLRYCGRKLGLPEIPITKWSDTEALAAMCGLPQSLGGCAAFLGVDEQKDKTGERLITLFSKGKAGKYRGDHKSHPKEFAQFGAYCAQDVATECSVRAKLPITALPGFERRVWVADYRVNERGVKLDLPLVRSAHALTAEAKAEGSRLLSEMTGGVITSPSQQARIIKYCNSRGAELTDLQKPTVADTIASSETPSSVRKLLELREESNMSSLAKYQAMLTAVCADGRVRGTHRYHGAGTGRWTGKIVQTQNLPRPKEKVSKPLRKLLTDRNLGLLDCFGPLLYTLRDCIRSAIIPSRGTHLAVSDMSSIEARVLGWMAGCDAYLEAYRKGQDLYIAMAAVIFAKTYEEIEAIYKADENCIERRIGKAVILGRGYGMGDEKFVITCHNQGVEISAALAAHAGKSYKTTFPEIPRLWKAYENAAAQAIRSNSVVECGVVSFSMFAGYLRIRLPSGRSLWYPEARLSMRDTKYGTRSTITFSSNLGKTKISETTYGGKLVENVDQAISRDLEAHALTHLDEENHFPVMHTHDEIICDSPDPPAALARLNELFTTACPDWAREIPLACKGSLMEYYSK